MFQWCVTDVSCEQIGPSSQLAYVSNFFLLHFCFDSLHRLKECLLSVCVWGECVTWTSCRKESMVIVRAPLLLCLFSLTFIQIHWIKCNEKIFCSLEYGISLKTILAVIIIRRRTKCWNIEYWTGWNVANVSKQNWLYKSKNESFSTSELNQLIICWIKWSNSLISFKMIFHLIIFVCTHA